MAPNSGLSTDESTGRPTATRARARGGASGATVIPIRPATSLVEERQRRQREAFLQAYASGRPIGIAAKLAGASRRTFERWRAADPEFAAAVAEATELHIETIEDRILDAGLQGDWRASLAYLRVKRPGIWGHNCPKCLAYEELNVIRSNAANRRLSRDVVLGRINALFDRLESAGLAEPMAAGDSRAGSAALLEEAIDKLHAASLRLHDAEPKGAGPAKRGAQKLD